MAAMAAAAGCAAASASASASVGSGLRPRQSSWSEFLGGAGRRRLLARQLPAPLAAAARISAFSSGGGGGSGVGIFGRKGSVLLPAAGAGGEVSGKGRREWRASAAAAESADGAAGAGDDTKLSRVQLGTYFGLWYLYNVIFNIYNKKALNVFPYPWFLATFQLVAGAVWMLGLWGLRLQPCPPVTGEFIRALLLPAFFHTVGHIAACVSFSKVAVSFTHIIKSAEPVFSVMFSSVLGESYPLLVWLSLLPIMFGCGLAAVTELSFNLGGFWGAMISNFGFVLRNIYSKRSLKNFKQYDGINLYGWITILSIVYLAPVAVILEGAQWGAGYKQAVAALGSDNTFLLWVGLSGVFYHLYNQSSYQALGGISPLTFSVGNTMKRVVVIIATVIAFRNPIRPLNAVGSAIAILGTFLYSQASANSKKAKAA